MKVIIPAGGYGTRMRPHTHTRPKPLVPVAGRPSLAFILDQLKPLPVDEVIVITGKLGEQMEQYVAEHYDYKARFIEQKVMRGCERIRVRLAPRRVVAPAVADPRDHPRLVVRDPVPHPVTERAGDDLDVLPERVDGIA